MKFDELDTPKKVLALQLFNELMQNEQQKALQAVESNRGNNAFGGTSVTAVVKQGKFKEHLEPKNFDQLADAIATGYVQESKALDPVLKKGFTLEEVNLFHEHGIFYGVHVSPKLIGLCEGLTVEHKELLLEGFPDPYQLPKEPKEVQEAYFKALKEHRGLELDINSLVLADTTTPAGFEGKKILNPSNLNGKLKDLSARIAEALRSRDFKTDPLYVICTDTDSPHRSAICSGQRPLEGYPLTPGLTMCGSTATMEGFDFKYMYRIGLIAQALSGNIIGSRIAEEFSPFLFIGMLSPFGYTNGAIDTGRMDQLRYSGNIDMKKEFLFQYERDIKRMMS